MFGRQTSYRKLTAHFFVISHIVPRMTLSIESTILHVPTTVTVYHKNVSTYDENNHTSIYLKNTLFISKISMPLNLEGNHRSIRFKNNLFSIQTRN